MAVDSKNDDIPNKRLMRLKATLSAKRDIATSRFNTLRDTIHHPPERDLRHLLNEYRLQQQESSKLEDS